MLPAAFSTKRRFCACRVFLNEVALDIVGRDGQRLPVLVNAVERKNDSRKL